VECICRYIHNLNINIFFTREHCEKYKKIVLHKAQKLNNWNITVIVFKESKLIYMHTYLLLQYWLQ